MDHGYKIVEYFPEFQIVASTLEEPSLIFVKKIARRTTGAQGNSFLTSCRMSQKTKFTYKYMFLLISKICDIY